MYRPLQQSTDFVGVYAPARGHLTQVSPAGAQLLGYASPAELLAAPAPFAAGLGAQWPALVAQARREGRAETAGQLP